MMEFIFVVVVGFAAYKYLCRLFFGDSSEYSDLPPEI
jgi:hypothetical protein